MSLATQLWHSVTAFVKLDVGGEGNKWNYLFGILFSLSTSFAILLFTVRGKKGIAYFFLAVEVFINVIHYSVIGMEAGPLLWSTMFMCAIVPITIAVYSDAVNEVPDDTDHLLSTENNSERLSEGLQEASRVKEILVDQSMYNGEPNIQIGSKLDSKQFLDEVNGLIGFDITNPDDKSGDISEEKKSELRKLWRKRKEMSSDKLKAEIHSVLRKTGQPLFN